MFVSLAGTATWQCISVYIHRSISLYYVHTDDYNNIVIVHVAIVYYIIIIFWISIAPNIYSIQIVVMYNNYFYANAYAWQCKYYCKCTWHTNYGTCTSTCTF